MAGGLELVEDPADALIHAVDHRGVDSHPGRLPFLVSLITPGTSAGVARGERPGAVYQAKLHLPFMPAPTEFIPADRVLVAIPCDVLLQGVHRPMWRGVGEIEEEGGVALGETLKVANCGVGNRVG